MRNELFTKTTFMFFLFCNLHAWGQQGLFISELADPGDDYTGRFLELYNSGSESINFDTQTFYLSRQSNGGTSYGDLLLTGMVHPGETYLIGTSSFSSHYGFLPDIESGILIGNGDDAYFLFEGGDHTTGILHDIFGVENIDGTGELWEYTDSRAVRNVDISSSSATWLADEWTINSANVEDCDPGVHHGNGGGDLPQPGIFSLSAGNDTIDIGQMAEVIIETGPVLLSDNIISYQFDLEYSTAALEFSGYNLGGTLSENGTIEVNSSTPGLISVSFMHTEPIIGEGSLVVLEFQTLVTDTSAVSLSNVYFNNVVVDDIESGIVIASENTPPSGFLVFSDTLVRCLDTLQIIATFSEAMDPDIPVTVSMHGATEQNNLQMFRVNDSIYELDFEVPNTGGIVNVEFSGGADLYGNIVNTLPDSGRNFSVIPISSGDVDDDGQILAYDAALALQFSVGLDPLPDTDGLPWETWRERTANVDGAGNVTAYDAALILQYSAGIIDEFITSTKKSGSDAKVTAELVNNEIVFYSEGDLIGLNIVVEEGKSYMGKPEIIHENYLHAVNISDDFYNIGMCTVYPLPGQTPILKIPVVENVPFTFNLLENANARTYNLNVQTGLNEIDMNKIRVYPNPVKEVLYIQFPDDKNPNFTHLRLMNLTGSILYESDIYESDKGIDISEFAGQGICLLSISGRDSGITKNFKVIIE